MDPGGRAPGVLGNEQRGKAWRGSATVRWVVYRLGPRPKASPPGLCSRGQEESAAWAPGRSGEQPTARPLELRERNRSLPRRLRPLPGGRQDTQTRCRPAAGRTSSHRDPPSGRARGAWMVSVCRSEHLQPPPGPCPPGPPHKDGITSTPPAA